MNAHARSKRLSPSSKLKAALDLGPQVLEYVVALNPHDFERLRNPLMRRLMPPRITLARIARMVAVDVTDLIRGIYRAAGVELDAHAEDELAAASDEPEDLPRNPSRRPVWVERPWVGRPTTVVDLLASDDRLDADPLPPIQRAVKKLAPGASVLIKHRWEPQPLYDVWKHMGLEHYAEEVRSGEWHVHVRRRPACQAGLEPALSRAAR